MSKPLTCFIIMPFDTGFLPVRDMIRRVVRARNLGRAVRSDDIFRPGNIIEQIKEAIQHADFCIADITDNNANVMWEVGYASALRKPVIAIRQHNEQLPFDVRQERFFNYEREKLSEIRPALTKAVESVVADLALKPQFLGWRYDELTNLMQTLRRCYPVARGRDLLTILKEAIRECNNSVWAVGDEERLMKGIAATTGKIERADSFWWLIVHGVLVYDQIHQFQVRGSVAYRDNLRLVKFSERGVALLNVLSQHVHAPTQEDKTEGGRTKLTEDEFFAKLETYSPEQALVARRILTWAPKHFDDVEWRSSSFVPICKYGGEFSHRPITVFGASKVPRVQIKFRRMKRRNKFSDKTLLELLDRLNAIPEVRISKNEIDKFPTIPLAILTKNKALDSFLRTIEWTVKSVKETHQD